MARSRNTRANNRCCVNSYNTLNETSSRGEPSSVQVRVNEGERVTFNASNVTNESETIPSSSGNTLRRSRRLENLRSALAPPSTSNRFLNAPPSNNNGERNLLTEAANLSNRLNGILQPLRNLASLNRDRRRRRNGTNHIRIINNMVPRQNRGTRRRLVESPSSLLRATSDVYGLSSAIHSLISSNQNNASLSDTGNPNSTTNPSNNRHSLQIIHDDSDPFLDLFHLGNTNRQDNGVRVRLPSDYITFGDLFRTRPLLNRPHIFPNMSHSTPRNNRNDNEDEYWNRAMVEYRTEIGDELSDIDDDTMSRSERRYPRRSSYRDTRRRIRNVVTSNRRTRISNIRQEVRFFPSFPLHIRRRELEERLNSYLPNLSSSLEASSRQINDSPKPFPVPKDEIDKIGKTEPEKCTICFEEDCTDPVKCLHCRQQIGCFDCLKKWIRADAYVNSNQEEYVMHSKNMACPLCRHEWSNASRPEVFRLQNK
uniref:RING-type domain-containing protein n=1 Tax=Parastrongyloides trichosuri TaxID=131310 RepID=A0A0N4ZT30_PARTI